MARPWPEDHRLDPVLLAEGDARNVVDRYRYWTVDAIRADLDATRHAFHVAIENFTHDFNIGSVVRTANAMQAATVQIVGNRRWNRRGAMVTDRYQHIEHRADAQDLNAWATQHGLVLIGVDNVPASHALETFALPKACVLVFGSESTGLSWQARELCPSIVSVTQFGSTRSMNVGAAAAIVMHAWIRRHVFNQSPT